MNASGTGGRRVSAEMLVGVAAILLSLGALVVSVVQTQIAREQQHAAVWPFLRIGSGRYDARFTLMLENKGVGPALIKRVVVTHAGQPYPTVIALLTSKLSAHTGSRQFAQLVPGDVVKAGEEVRLFEVDRDPASAGLLSALVDDSSFTLRVTYGDVYDNCWQATTRGVEALASCPKQ
jgi:hypothetical protein